MIRRLMNRDPMSSRRLAGWSRGQAAVETTMSVMLWLILVFGIIEFAYAMYCYDQVSDAAKLGVRYAIVHGTSSSSPANTSQITSYLTSQLSGMDTSTSDGYFTVTAACGSGSSNSTPPCDPGYTVSLQVKYNFRFAESMVPGNLKSVMLSANSQGTVSQ